mgnify:CR=1 FL=1
MTSAKFVHVAEPRDGARHSIGVTVSGEAYSWGKNNNFGQLGQGPATSNSSKSSTQKDALPVELEIKDNNKYPQTTVRFVKGFVGGFPDSGHSALLDSEGNIWLAGCDRWQQLGLGSSSGGSAGYTWNQGRVWRNKFVRNEFLATIAGPIRDVSLGGDHTVALSTNRKDVYVFGKGGEGQLGLDGKPFVSAPARSKVLSSDKEAIAAVCAVQHCSATISRNGDVLNKAGKCRNVVKAIQQCIQQARLDGLLDQSYRATK